MKTEQSDLKQQQKSTSSSWKIFQPHSITPWLMSMFLKHKKPLGMTNGIWVKWKEKMLSSKPPSLWLPSSLWHETAQPNAVCMQLSHRGRAVWARWKGFPLLLGDFQFSGGDRGGNTQTCQLVLRTILRKDVRVVKTVFYPHVVNKD